MYHLKRVFQQYQQIQKNANFIQLRLPSNICVELIQIKIQVLRARHFHFQLVNVNEKLISGCLTDGQLHCINENF